MSNIFLYRKKPIYISAIQLRPETFDECTSFIYPEGAPTPNIADKEACTILIKTLEGDMIAKEGDYIIQGVNAEFYPCKPDIFEKSYDPARKENGSIK